MTASRLFSQAMFDEDTGGLYIDGGLIKSDGKGNLTASSYTGGIASYVIYPQTFGAKGDGVRDDGSSIQLALDDWASIPGSVLEIPTGVYMTSISLIYRSQSVRKGIITGAGDGATVIRVIPGTNLATPILAAYGWWNNNTNGDFPVAISDMQLDGNNAMTGTVGHGMVAMNYQSSYDRMSFTNVSGSGFQFTAYTKNGTHIANTCNECKLSRLQVRTCGGVGIYVHDQGGGINSCTDGFLQDCIVTGASLQGIFVEMGPGWLITGNHVYGTGLDAINVQRGYATRIEMNYIDGYGSGSATFIAGIGLDFLDGRGCTVKGNIVGYESSSATGPYQSIRVNGSGSNASAIEVSGNFVNGNNSGGSLGYVMTTSTSQQAFPCVVYFFNNFARNVNTYSFVDSFVTYGETQVYGHVSSGGTAPTAVAGANAGTSPPVPVRNNCTDVSGNITFGSGSSATAGIYVAVTFAHSYANNAPSVTLTPTTTASAGTTYYVTVTTSGFTINLATGFASSQANTVYGFNYLVMR